MSVDVGRRKARKRLTLKGRWSIAERRLKTSSFNDEEAGANRACHEPRPNHSDQIFPFPLNFEGDPLRDELQVLDCYTAEDPFGTRLVPNTHLQVNPSPLNGEASFPTPFFHLAGGCCNRRVSKDGPPVTCDARFGRTQRQHDSIPPADVDVFTFPVREGFPLPLDGVHPRYASSSSPWGLTRRNRGFLFSKGFISRRPVIKTFRSERFRVCVYNPLSLERVLSTLASNLCTGDATGIATT